ncbi:hypothetical protein CO655_32285 [Rhizobium sp. M1]|nr:hypothetical protein CO655_32285 [Rhizobium sp. M1]
MAVRQFLVDEQCEWRTRRNHKPRGLPRMDTFEKPLWWLLNLFGLGRILLKQEPWSGTGLL